MVSPLLGLIPMSQLEIPPEQFWRVAGYVLSLANDYLGELDTLPSFPPDASGEELSQAFDEPLPQQGAGEDALVALMGVLRWSRPPSPRFFGYVLGSGVPVPVLESAREPGASPLKVAP